MIGYGSASDFEGATAAPPLSVTASAQRRAGGCADPDANAADAEAVSPPPAPRMTASATVTCAGIGVSADAGTATITDASTADDAGPPAIDAGLAVDAGFASSGDGLVISQVFGGGGSSGAPYTHDFVELFNRCTQPVGLGGLDPVRQRKRQPCQTRRQRAGHGAHRPPRRDRRAGSILSVRMAGSMTGARNPLSA